MNYKPKKIIVTGGAGFVGSNYVRYVLAHDQEVEVITLDKLTYAGSKDNLKDLPDKNRHHFVEMDILDKEGVDDMLREFDVDTVVHFAAESHVDRSIAGPGPFIETNIIGTYTLLSACRRYWFDKMKWTPEQCRFHHISTDEVYGELSKDAPAFTEITAYSPRSPYSASKASSDHLAKAYFHTYGLPVTMTNCSNNYGPYQHAEKLIPTVINACLKQEPIPVYGNGSNIRDWLYVDDHCDAIHAVLCNSELGETYNVGGNAELSNLDLVKKICEIMDKKIPDNAPHANLISFVEDRLGHDWRYAIDNSKILADIKWQPKMTLEAGLEKTVDFYLA